MTKLECNATCYMPVEVAKKGKKTQQVLERFEDGDELLEVSDDLAEAFVATGNFKQV